MKEQIEEIYEVLVTDCGMPCPECDYEGDDLCVAHRKAEALYNAGYRKQKEGEWIEHSEIGAMNNAWECSACHWKTVSFTEMKHSNFCPNCGANMKGEQTKKEHFSPEEVHNMTPKEVRENLAAIMGSMRKWK